MNAEIVDMLTRLAVENPGVRNRFKLAAGIVYRNHLIATGVNSCKTHPLMLQFGKNSEALFIHAEIDAIKNALRLITQDQLAKCDMYVVRVKRPDNDLKNWQHAMARPCSGCQRAIISFGLKNIYYTTEDCNGPIAHDWLEQRTHNPLVLGSTPSGPTIKHEIYS